MTNEVERLISGTVEEKEGKPEGPWRVEDVMEWTGMSRRYLLDLARQGIMPARKIGGTWFFSHAKLAEFFGVKE